MKKLILLSACLLAVPALHAEQMQFVTTLSAPVGNFAHLDAADPTHVTSAPLLNFCNTRSGVGDIIIKGANAYIAQANILNGATLGSANTPEYRLSEKLTVENGGTVTAGRLMASNVTFKDTNFHKSNVTGTLYGSDLTVKGGKTDNMEIASTAKITKSAQASANLGQTMEWSNQYSSDYDSSGNKKANGNTYTSFLLKSKGGTTTPTTECTPGATASCGSVCCKSQKTCQSDGTWGECKRGTQYSTHDSYCSLDGESYYCGASCEWSDSSNSCVPISGVSVSCPSLSYALQQGKERCFNSSLSDNKKYTCFTSTSWKTKSMGYGPDSAGGASGGGGHWRLISYSAEMLCGNETIHNSGYVTPKAGQEYNCTVGQEYLYNETYGCTNNIGGGYSVMGWSCLKCGQTDDLSKCIVPASVNGKDCGSSAGGPSGFMERT